MMPEHVRIDVAGTVFGHPTVGVEVALDFARVLRERGMDVRFWTSMIASVSDHNRRILEDVAPLEEKPLMPPPCPGWLVVDDDPGIRRAYQRLGATAVDMADAITVLALDIDEV
jgi:hypothetical protein